MHWIRNGLLLITDGVSNSIWLSTECFTTLNYLKYIWFIPGERLHKISSRQTNKQTNNNRK